jgi:hypothetical protein
VQRNALPAPGDLRGELLAEPAQKATRAPAFKTTVNQINYSVKPLYDYDIYGVVVSKHNADTWWDWAHQAWNDHLNVTDLCVVWGSNIKNDSYRTISFSSGQWTCNFETRSAEAYAAFDQTAISNNHVLTDKPALAARLRQIRIGDQIRITGQLAEYRHQAGTDFFRGTSTVRNDTGNGACETIFVSDVEILKRAPAFWRNAGWLAMAGLLLCLAAWWRQPVRPRA